MKGIILIGFLIVFAVACQDPSMEQFRPDNVWSITWQADQQVATGSIYLSENNEAKVVIDHPDHFFFTDDQEAYFTYSFSTDTFTLTRQDNGISLQYKILQRDENSYKLSYADNLIVSISR